jgi:nucleoside-diphosphate-sugar epimerase
MSTRFLVIGGSGFTGGFVLDEMTSRGLDVVAMARSEQAAAKLRAKGVDVVMGDLDVTSSLERAMLEAKADRLVNLASLGFGHAPSLLATAERVGFEHCVFVSTTAIFTKLNAASKAVRVAAERTITESSLSWTILRPTMIYGAPGDRNMERLIRWLRRTRVMALPGGGTGLQQPVHVADLALAVAGAAQLPVGCCTAYDVPGPEPLSFRAVVDATADAIGCRVVVVPIPVRPARWAVAVQERHARKPRLKCEQIDRLVEDKVFDARAASDLLGHSPRSFVDGIRTEADLIGLRAAR